MVGKVIHDRFRIIAPIARGGMGAVYKAEQAPLGRLVALKILSPKHEEDQDPEFRKRFFLEAATVAKLSHPNTVTVFDYGQSDNLYFIVMELIAGVTLKKAIRTAGHFEPKRAIHIGKQICRSLREAHRLGVIHRDMKPGNVMLLEQGDEQDYVKVLDFGLVKDIEKPEDEEDLTQTGVFMGSPKYMSPEQIQGLQVDRRSDIYSVGILLYEMLTGKPPFVREKQVQILMDHINAPVPPLAAPDGSPIPEELAQVVYKCLSKQADDRYPDMEQLLIALKSVAGELRLSMPPSEALGITGDFRLTGTPVSGIHNVGDELAQSTSNGQLRAPGVTSSISGGGPIPSSPPSAAVAAADALDAGRPSGKMAIVLGALGFLGALVILFFVVDPFGSADVPLTEDASQVGSQPVATDQPAAGDPAAPVVDDAPVDEEVSVEEPPVEAEPPAAIVSVLVELDSRPDGATVHIGDTEYGPTPLQVELTGAQAEPGTELTFLFSRHGHRDTTVVRTVPADGRLDVSARLRRAWEPPSNPRPPSHTNVPQQTVTPAGYRESPY